LSILDADVGVVGQVESEKLRHVVTRPAPRVQGHDVTDEPASPLEREGAGVAQGHPLRQPRQQRVAAFRQPCRQFLRCDVEQHSDPGDLYFKGPLMRFTKYSLKGAQQLT
jgi:hypothetical protein